MVTSSYFPTVIANWLTQHSDMQQHTQTHI
jgi:hypothetical protein